MHRPQIRYHIAILSSPRSCDAQARGSSGEVAILGSRDAQALAISHDAVPGSRVAQALAISASLC